MQIVIKTLAIKGHGNTKINDEILSNLSCMRKTHKIQFVKEVQVGSKP